MIERERAGLPRVDRHDGRLRHRADPPARDRLPDEPGLPRGHAGQGRRPPLHHRSAPVPELARPGQGQARPDASPSSARPRPSSARTCPRWTRRRRRCAQAEGELAKAMAMQVKTQLEVERYIPLVARGSLSQQELDNTVQNNIGNQAQVAAEQANLDKARASVARAQAGVDKARADISAAEAGIVQAKAGLDEAQLNLELGQGAVADQRRRGDQEGRHRRPGRRVHACSPPWRSIDPIYVQFNLTEQQYLRWREAAQGSVAARRAHPDGADPGRRPAVSDEGDGGDPRPRGRRHHRHDRRPGVLPQSGQRPAARPVRARCGSPSTSARTRS